MHDAIAGCLVNDANQTKVCGAVMLDTGAPGIRITGSDAASGWRDGAATTLLIADEGGYVKVSEQITLGQRAQASHFTVDAGARGPPIPVIYIGLTPYLAFSVLYDPEHGVIGFKPRPPGPGGPQGMVR